MGLKERRKEIEKSIAGLLVGNFPAEKVLRELRSIKATTEELISFLLEDGEDTTHNINPPTEIKT